MSRRRVGFILPAKPRTVGSPVATKSKEAAVLSDLSLLTMAKEIGNGLTLAMYLNIPNTKIVLACNGISETGLRDAEAADYITVTDNLLRYWKLTRATVRDRKKVDELESALRAAGKNDLADVLADRHQMNMEITADAFPQN